MKRREFLKRTALAASPLIVPGAVLGLGESMAPSERITIGVLGVGNRGTSSIHSMRPLPDHQVLAISDCRQPRALQARQMVNEMYADRIAAETYAGCDIHEDFRELLARDDIDLIWQCVPDHWHGPITRLILESGKDVYGEKPLTRWIDQGSKVVELVRRYGTVFQTGTQQRSDPRFAHAAELARNGYLGKVNKIQVISPGGCDYEAIPPTDVPEGFNYDMWTGPAPYFPFDTKRCEWLAMYMISHYCAGFITNWGVHHLDIAGWGIPEVFEKPFTISGTGVLPQGGMTDTWISWRTKLQWESGLQLDYLSNNHVENGAAVAPEDGCLFQGDEGWVFVNRSVIRAEPASLLQLQLTPSDQRLFASPLYADPYTGHSANLFESVRTRRDPVSTAEAGHAASTLGNVADIALRLGRSLTWNPAAQSFENDDRANEMKSRACRSPWII